MICWKGRWGGGGGESGWLGASIDMGDLLEEELGVGKVDGWVDQ